jgi:hypothetical protein
VLEEDGTEVDDEEYFQSLPDNTRLMLDLLTCEKDVHYSINLISISFSDYRMLALMKFKIRKVEL